MTSFLSLACKLALPLAALLAFACSVGCDRVHVLGETPPASMGGVGAFVSDGPRADQGHMLKQCPDGYEIDGVETVWNAYKERDERHISFSCQRPYAVSKRAPEPAAPSAALPAPEAPSAPAAPLDSRYWVEPVTPEP